VAAATVRALLRKLQAAGPQQGLFKLTQSQSDFLSKKTPRSFWAGDRFEFLRELVASGGPGVADYPRLTAVFAWFHEVGFGEVVRRELAPTLTTETMQGFSYLKPHGYSGDYEIIDRIYSFWRAPEPSLARWDEYFHAQPAPRAVRNRKAYFARLATELHSTHAGGAQVLNVGCGPARDLDEYLSRYPSADVQIHSLETDPNAIEFARKVCRHHHDRARFQLVNALRFTPNQRYDLIWSAGLLDYFSDRTLQIFVRRYRRALTPGGSLVIGNFGPGNSSRPYMELVGDWHLHHRPQELLTAIAHSAGIEPAKVQIDEEPEGVNLFLRIRA